MRECSIQGETAILRPLPHKHWLDTEGTVRILHAMCEEAFALDRAKVRAYADRDLSSRRMAMDYLAVYAKVIQ